MATYTKVYNNPYPDGWKDGKDGNTPVTAEILNNQTETLESIEQYLEDNPIEQGGSGTGGTTDYEALENKPTINGVEVVGDLSLEDLGITGGGGSGTTDYNDLSNKPSINGTELSGDITLDIPTKTSDLTNDSGFLTDIKGESYNDLSDKPQINGIDLQGNLTVEELGLLDITESTDTTLENSKDGILKIKEIYGNTEQGTTSGKNLLDCSGLTEQTINGVTFTPKYSETEEDVKKGYPLGSLMYINANGTATATSEYIFIINPMLPEGDLILSGCPSGGSNETYSIQYSNNTDFAYREFGSGVTIQQFNYEDYPATSVKIRVLPNTVCNNLKFYPMIRYAENGDDTYEPFTNGASPNPSYPQEIKSVVLSEIKTCGKNLFDYSKLVYGTINSTTGAEESHTTVQRTDYIPCKSNTGYTISNMGSGTSRISYFSKDKKIIKSTLYSNANGTITTPNDCSFFVIQSVNTNWTTETMIEQGTTATEYEPYTESVVTLSEPITLNGLNGVQDYVDMKRGVNRQECFVKVFDGTEGLSSWTNTSGGGILLAWDNKNIKPSPIDNVPFYGFCNYLSIVSSGSTWSSNKPGFAVGTNLNQIRFRLGEDITTVAQAKEWLAEKYASGNPFTIVVPIAEPIETPLPDADVQALKSLKTYDGVTHIFTDSEVAPSWLLEYNTTRVGTELDEIDAELVKINKRITDIGTTAQMNYSTEEQVVGTWIDGKPIYEKVIELDIVIQDTSRWADTDVDLGEIEVFIKGTVLDIYNQSFPAAMGWIGEPKNIAVLINPSATNCETKYLIVQYTKTTDTV